MKAACCDYIEVRYNRKRLHSSLGYQSPKQYLQNWLAKRKEMLVAWRLTLIAAEKRGEGQSDNIVAVQHFLWWSVAFGIIDDRILKYTVPLYRRRLIKTAN